MCITLMATLTERPAQAFREPAVHAWFTIVRMRRHCGLFFCVALVLSACAAPAVPQTTATDPAPVQPTATPAPSPTPPPTTALLPDRPQYSLEVSLDYAARTVQVVESILYPNRGDELADLVLAVVPNLWAGSFTLDSLAVQGLPVSDYTLSGQRLAFALPAPAADGSSLRVDVKYSLALPAAIQADPADSRPRIFGYTDRQINLTNWYPFIVPRIGGQWVLHDPWYYGEHLVYDASDYTVTLNLTGTQTPVVAASGAIATPGTQTYALTAGRSFVISASTAYQTVCKDAGAVSICSYYLQPIYEPAARAALDAAASAVGIYTDRFGPYLHASLAVVMGDFNDGMEYSGLFFLSRDFYNLYDGSPRNYLTFVAAHETAHQWWFEQVANDQAMQPWLDEALCTYSERIFYEGTRTELIPWWWSYRVDYYQPQGYVDTSIYDGGGFRPYTNAVYLRGGHFLDELRTLIGDDAFFAFLKDYLETEKGGIAAAADFFRILRAHTRADLTGLLGKYMQGTY